ncbi:MAG: hypothetical protein NTV86_15750 [Planctomycetota bacterium]|nr:hypothetical protein [Planctomycetota bacterium]
MITRHSFIPMAVRLAVACLVLALGGQAALADYKSDMGYTALAAELGAAMPTGADVPVSQVEAPLVSGAYCPDDVTDSELIGKNYTWENGYAGVSGHATTVARYYYGSTLSFAPGISTINVYNANSFLTALKAGKLSDPAFETSSVQSDSWIGSYVDPVNPTSAQITKDIQTLRRFDYTIQRDDFVGVVAVNNGSATAIPSLLASSYNSITVGMSNGNHSHGLTSLQQQDGSGRIKPEIVGSTDGILESGNPAPYVSFVVPLVSGAAAELLQVAAGNSSLSLASHSQTVKAILLAGATKTQFPTWSRTPTAPLDTTYGAGQLNVYNNYHILTAGRQQASSSATVGSAGWDFNTTSASQTQTYFFDVPGTTAFKEFSVVLTWNRVLTPDSFFGMTQLNSSLANLDLKLYNASGFALGALVDSSVNTTDNIEHIYGSLLPGRYALEVSSSYAASTDYALAWRNRPTLPGDANLDGEVGPEDFGLLKDNFGVVRTDWAHGDFSGDGEVGPEDFGILKDNFGASLPGLAPFAPLVGGSDAPVGLTVTPEPASLLLLLGLSAPAWWRKRRAPARGAARGQ